MENVNVYAEEERERERQAVGRMLDHKASSQAYCAAQVMAGKFHDALKCEEKDARAYITRVEGKKRRGYRVVVIRMSDGMTKTGFCKD